VPYVLKHRETGEIAACMLKNVYDLDYFGVKWWDSPAEASVESARLLAELGRRDAAMWDVVEIDSSTLKLGNVKLNNDPRRTLYMDEQGKLRAR